MANANSIITKPVRQWSDVRSVLGITSTGIIALCTSAAINPGSKHKPVRLSTKFPDRTSEWWRGDDGRCGFDIPSTAISISSLDEDAVWAYLRPRGSGYNEYHRQMDFDGYWHSAPWNWGLPAVASKVFSGSSFVVGFNLLTVNNNGLTYGDLFKPANADDTKGIYVSFYKGGTTNSPLVKKAAIDWSTGKCTVTVTAAEVSGMGLSVGGMMYVHLYGMYEGKYVSLRNHASVTTLFKVPVFSASSFAYTLNCAVLYKSGTYYTYYIYNLAAQLDATYYAGGTLAAGSVIRIFKYVSGTSVDRYHSLYSPIWSSATIGAVTAASGSVTTALSLSGYTEINWYGDAITSVVIIWYSSGNAVLASVNRNVSTVTNI